MAEQGLRAVVPTWVLVAYVFAAIFSCDHFFKLGAFSAVIALVYLLTRLDPKDSAFLEFLDQVDEALNAQAVLYRPAKNMEFDSPRQLEAAFRDMHPCFEGKETEQNWQQRDKNVDKLKKITAGSAPTNFTAVYLAGIRSLLDGILKTANSLRTTLSTNGCLLIQDIANAVGSGIDNMVDILLQNLIKLCANTKPISRSNANYAVLAILSNVSYHARLMNHISAASQDKNILPRRFACAWLKKIIKRHPRNVIEHAGGLDLIEKSLKTGLEDKDKEVREAMRPTFWAYARRWPERSDAILYSLDKIKQDQLLADESNPNRPNSETAPLPSAAPETKSKFSKSTTSANTGKPSLKEVKAKLAAEKTSHDPIILSSLDNIKQDQPPMDESNPNRNNTHIVPPLSAGPETKSKFSKSTSSAPTGKPSMKEAKAKLTMEKTSQVIGERPNSAMAHSSRTFEDATPARKTTGAAVPEHRNNFSRTINAKPSFKDIKARVAAQKRAQAASEAGSRGEIGTDVLAHDSALASQRSHKMLLDSRSDVQTAATASLDNKPKPSSQDGKAKVTVQKRLPENSQSTLIDSQSVPTSHNSPEKMPTSEFRKTGPRHDHMALPTPPESVVDDDLLHFALTFGPTSQKKPNFPEQRPSSADGPVYLANRHATTAAARMGNLTSAPMRPRRKPIAKKAEADSSNPAAPPDFDDPQDLESQTGLRQRSEPLREDEIPDGTLSTEKASTESELPSKQDVFKVNEPFEAVKHNSQKESIESPMQSLKLLQSAQIRIEACSLDIHGFRKLQHVIRDQRSNASIWQEGYKIEELLLPLLEWFELPFPSPVDDVAFGHALDLKTQMLSTVRLLLKHYHTYTAPFFARTLSTLLVARTHFSGTEHLVSELEKTLSWIVAHCHPRECISTICEMVDDDLGARAHELALRTLSALLHRLHTVPTDGDGGLGQMFRIRTGSDDGKDGNGEDDALARRLGRITTALLDDPDLVTRRAAIEVAIDFYYCVPEEVFFSLVTRQNENQRNVLLYYLSRDRRIEG